MAFHEQRDDLWKYFIFEISIENRGQCERDEHGLFKQLMFVKKVFENRVRVKRDGHVYDQGKEACVWVIFECFSQDPGRQLMLRSRLNQDRRIEELRSMLDLRLSQFFIQYFLAWLCQNESDIELIRLLARLVGNLS